MKRQVIIIFGPPGAGKGTQAQLLAEKLGLYHLEASKVLEEKFKELENLPEDSKERFIRVNGENFDVFKEKELWTKGFLCSPPFVVQLMKEKIKKLSERGEDLILSGSPRTVYEARQEIPLLKELYGAESIKVFFVKISAEETIFRNSHRKICELMRHPILYNKETETLTTCPLDGSKLIRREGLDDPEIIKTRLKEYEEKTFPMTDVYKTEGVKITEINGEQSVSDVFGDILKAL